MTLMNFHPLPNFPHLYVCFDPDMNYHLNSGELSNLEVFVKLL